MKVTTRSGTVYIFSADKSTAIRHSENSAEMRRDGEELQLQLVSSIEVGKPISMMIGAIEPGVVLTMRTTSPVEKIEESGE